MMRSFDMLDQCRENDIYDTACDDEETAEHIECGRCGHTLADPEEIINIETPHTLSVARMDIFGQDNVTVNELDNPGNFHFRSFNVRNSSWMVHEEGWQVIGNWRGW